MPAASCARATPAGASNSATTTDAAALAAVRRPRVDDKSRILGPIMEWEGDVS
jgi:hypothetical protein